MVFIGPLGLKGGGGEGASSGKKSKRDREATTGFLEDMDNARETPVSRELQTELQDFSVSVRGERPLVRLTPDNSSLRSTAPVSQGGSVTEDSREPHRKRPRDERQREANADGQKRHRRKKKDEHLQSENARAGYQAQQHSGPEGSVTAIQHLPSMPTSEVLPGVRRDLNDMGSLSNRVQTHLSAALAAQLQHVQQQCASLIEAGKQPLESFQQVRQQYVSYLAILEQSFQNILSQSSQNPQRRQGPPPSRPPGKLVVLGVHLKHIDHKA